MIMKINKSVAKGRMKAPPSKSVAHRYLICGALSNKSVVKNIDYSKDIDATLKCLEKLGAFISYDKSTVNIGGIDFINKSQIYELDCNESGSTLRFLIPLCLIFNKKIKLIGSKRLFSRSLSVYEKIFKEQNIEYKKTDNSITIKGELKPGCYKVRGDISSQFISGLMFALPLLDGDSTIEINNNIESNSYLSLTIKALADFGIRISRLDERTFVIKGNQVYKNRELTVEGDYSNSVFFEALNLFGSNIVLTGLKKESVQGDKIYREYFEVLKEKKPVIDISDCPDLGPILMGISAVLNGAKFIGTKRLKIKESNRGQAMACELAKFGCKVTVDENEIVVNKGISVPKVNLFGHNDHRIVMTLAVLCSLTGGVITNSEAVSKSLPDFFERLNKLGIVLERIE